MVLTPGSPSVYPVVTPPPAHCLATHRFLPEAGNTSITIATMTMEKVVALKDAISNHSKSLVYYAHI